MAQFKSKKAIVDTLKQQIQSNPKQAVRALLRIYENQNESEREYQCTMFKDGCGFTQNQGLMRYGVGNGAVQEQKSYRRYTKTSDPVQP